jgi:hypothetical protein
LNSFVSPLTFTVTVTSLLGTNAFSKVRVAVLPSAFALTAVTLFPATVTSSAFKFFKPSPSTFKVVGLIALILDQQSIILHLKFQYVSKSLYS